VSPHLRKLMRSRKHKRGNLVEHLTLFSSRPLPYVWMLGLHPKGENEGWLEISESNNPITLTRSIKSIPKLLINTTHKWKRVESMEYLTFQVNMKWVHKVVHLTLHVNKEWIHALNHSNEVFDNGTKNYLGFKHKNSLTQNIYESKSMFIHFPLRA
jgi:hypothetical protein